MFRTSQVLDKPARLKPQETTPRKPERTIQQDKQLRKDRIVAAVMLLVVAALMGLVVWLATISPPSDSSTFDDMLYYW